MWPSSKHKQELLLRLRTLGIQKVVVEFSGSGDSGSIEDVCCTDSQDKEIEIKTEEMEWEEQSSRHDGKEWIRETKPVIKKLVDILEQVTCDALEDQGLDWYNNDGGQGNLTIDFRESPPKITLECGLNYTSTEDHEFDLSQFDENTTEEQ